MVWTIGLSARDTDGDMVMIESMIAIQRRISQDLKPILSGNWSFMINSFHSRHEDWATFLHSFALWAVPPAGAPRRGAGGAALADAPLGGLRNDASSMKKLSVPEVVST